MTTNRNSASMAHSFCCYHTIRSSSCKGFEFPQTGYVDTVNSLHGGNKVAMGISRVTGQGDTDQIQIIQLVHFTRSDLDPFHDIELLCA